MPPSRAGGRRAVGHAGGAIGGNALLIIYPDDGVAVAVAANIAGIGYPQGGARPGRSSTVSATTRHHRARPGAGEASSRRVQVPFLRTFNQEVKR